MAYKRVPGVWWEEIGHAVCDDCGRESATCWRTGRGWTSCERHMKLPESIAAPDPPLAPVPETRCHPA